MLQYSTDACEDGHLQSADNAESMFPTCKRKLLWLGKLALGSTSLSVVVHPHTVY